MNKNLPPTKFIITTKGDPELGDTGQTAEIFLWVPPTRAGGPDHMAATKTRLKATFEEIWDDPAVTVEIDPLVITTTYGIRTNPQDLSRGSLNVSVHVNGEQGQSNQFMSGPIEDIEQFVAGKIDQAEVNRRWGFKSKLATLAADGEVAVEIIRPFADLPAGTKAHLFHNPAARCYQMQIQGFGIIEVPTNVGRNLDAYFKVR